MPATHRRPLSRASTSLLALLATTWLASCASFESDRHVAPLYTRVSRAGGGSETEALGGSVLVRHARLDEPASLWGIRPLFIHERLPDDLRRTDFLYPLGTVRRDPSSLTWQLLPVARYNRVEEPTGRRWSFISLTGIYFAGYPDGRRVRGWFPFGGVVHGTLTFDRLEWILFPLYARSVRQGRTSYHVLWPIFAYGRSEDSGVWRVWPLVGRSWREGSRDSFFVLWPVFQHVRSNLKARESMQRRDVMVFPLWGLTTQGEFRSHVFLWPFFGYASNPATGFWAVDAPWPLVRISRPGTGNGPYRTRVWPLFSHYRGDGLDQRTWAWPIFVRRREEYAAGSKRAFNVVPFWQGSLREYDDPERDPVRWRKLWPLFQSYDAGDHGRSAIVRLDPFWRLPTFDLHYAWLWEAYTREWEPGIERTRSWLGLWRRERGPDEDRSYLSGLWSRRRYSREGAAVSEHSLLLGLVRWRSGGPDSLRFLRPAFPGPGWPLERMPSTLPDAGAAPLAAGAELAETGGAGARGAEQR